MTEPRIAPKSATLTIGVLAACSGVSVETIRYYQRRGLLREPPRPAHGIRRYGAEHADRVHFIKSAQRLGFTIDDVSRLLVLDEFGSLTKSTHKTAPATLNMAKRR